MARLLLAFLRVSVIFCGSSLQGSILHGPGVVRSWYARFLDAMVVVARRKKEIDEARAKQNEGG